MVVNYWLALVLVYPLLFLLLLATHFATLTLLTLVHHILKKNPKNNYYYNILLAVLSAASSSAAALANQSPPPASAHQNHDHIKADSYVDTHTPADPPSSISSSDSSVHTIRHHGDAYAHDADVVLDDHDHDHDHDHEHHVVVVHRHHRDHQRSHELCRPRAAGQNPVVKAGCLAPVACGDCGRSKFKSIDALHQHQWDMADHVRVSRQPVLTLGSPVRRCSHCLQTFVSANDLERHFVREHPLIQLPVSEWNHVAADFRANWKKAESRLGEVSAIFKVYNPGWRRKDFEDYRRTLKNKATRNKCIQWAEDRKRILKDGNELSLYHGTTVKCTIGQTRQLLVSNAANSASSSFLCDDQECSLCRILQVGFKKNKCRRGRFQRYGAGIYCSSVSSKANDYVKCSLPDYSYPASSHESGAGAGHKSLCKVMIVSKVLVGHVYPSSQNITNLTAPPAGYDSVRGVPGPVLNYDEVIVYDDAAILPCYIILYSTSSP